MRHPVRAALLAIAALVLTPGASASPEPEEGVIRLGNVPQPPSPEHASEEVRIEQPRRGFNFEAFATRLESLWFQRKTFLGSGRESDGSQQLEQLRAFTAEEGVKRLENLAGALLAEAARYTEEGNYERALAALYYAEAFDPGRPQIHLGRAAVYWKSGRGFMTSGAEFVTAFRASLSRSIQDLTLFHRAALAVALALLALAVTFPLLVLLRYQTAFRHEIEEWAREFAGGNWPVLIGLAALGLPLLTWVGAGWAILYWIVITFRFMSRQEKAVATTLLLAGVSSVPLFGMAVGLYGTTADPAVRATVASVGGEYDPDRIVRLRQLVDAHPEDPVYRFLLAGLYKNGRYFEESFTEYKKVLEVNPALTPAHINIGNIFYATGQYSEAITNYRRALDLEANSLLAYFNLHLAQSEDFRFSAADESLRMARSLDADRVADLLSAASGWGDRPAVQEASLRMGSVWEAAIGGRRPVEASATRGAAGSSGFRWFHSVSLMSLLALAACAGSTYLARISPPARRCIRCGRPFCHHCKSAREAREYCSQCLHLYVLRDGLAPGTKSRKLYEVERYERNTRRVRSFVSIFLPGATHLLRGKTTRAVLLLTGWFLALVVAHPSLANAGNVVGLRTYPELLLGSTEVPLAFHTNPLLLAAYVALPLIWIAGNAWRWQRAES